MSLFILFSEGIRLDLELIDYAIKIVGELRRKLEHETSTAHKEVRKDLRKRDLAVTDNEWVDDEFADRVFMISELERNFLNSLAIALNTILEENLKYVLRVVKNQDYSRKSLSEMIHQVISVMSNGSSEVDKLLVERINSYVRVRNCLAHSGGYIGSDSSSQEFVNKNINLFDMNEHLQVINVRVDYLKQVENDIKKFFEWIDDNYTSQ